MSIAKGHGTCSGCGSWQRIDKSKRCGACRDGARLAELWDDVKALRQQLAEEKAARERAEDAHDRAVQMFLAADQRIEQLEAVLTKVQTDLERLQKAAQQVVDASPDKGPLWRGSNEIGKLLEAISLAQPQEIDEIETKRNIGAELMQSVRETLPLIARETAERLDGPSAKIGNLYAMVNGEIYRIADTDEHGLPVVVREPGMDPWAKYVHRSSDWISYYRDLTARSDKTGFQRIEDYRESGQEG